MKVKDYLDRGGIFIDEKFLDEKIFLELKEEFNKFQYKVMHQPAHIYYGNRFQSYPVYDVDITKNKWGEIIKKQLEKSIQQKIFDCKFRARRIVMEEVKQSQFDREYAGIHHDGEFSKYAAVLYFDQSFKGGTGFFRYSFDHKPDTYISAYPNKIIIYKGQRWHAAFNDFTYAVRQICPLFFDIKN